MSHPLARLLAYATTYRGRIGAASVCSVLNKLFDLAPPVLIGAAVDMVVEKQDSLFARLGASSMEEQLAWLAGLTILVWGLESIFEYAYQVLWGDLSQDVQRTLRLDAYAHIQTLELGYFEDRSTGGLMAILNDDVNQLQRFLDEGANALLQVGTTVVVVSAGFVALSPKVALLACLPIPLVLAGSFAYQRRIGPRYKVVREAVADLSGLLSNNLQGVATIKSFTAEGYEVARVSGASRAYQDANQAAIRVSSAFSPLIRMVIVCGFVGTIVSGGWMVHTGALAVGSYSVMVFLTQRLLWPLTRLAQTLDLYQRAMASTTRVLDLLDTAPTIVDGPRELEEVRGAVRFEGVEFAYPDGRRVLHGVDVAVPAGKEVAVVGLTGSGKTTLVKLLLRFYQHQGGVVSLDGHPVEELTLASLRGAIGLVSQDVFLLHGSVLENIAYGDPAPDRERAVAAARTAEAEEFIDQLPDGYDTLIGERGKKLSGGQRQRLALARAVYKDPPVLVLDEATSAVDNETEAAIQRSMARLRADRTVLVIAHRLSTVRDADEIVVLHQGAVAERGTHAELLATGGVYASLWKVQTGEAQP